MEMCISYVSKSLFTVIESENNRYGLFIKNIGSIKIKKVFIVLGIHILKKYSVTLLRESLLMQDH